MGRRTKEAPVPCRVDETRDGFRWVGRFSGPSGVVVPPLSHRLWGSAVTPTSVRDRRRRSLTGCALFLRITVGVRFEGLNFLHLQAMWLRTTSRVEFRPSANVGAVLLRTDCRRLVGQDPRVGPRDRHSIYPSERPPPPPSPTPPPGVRAGRGRLKKIEALTLETGLDFT